MLKINRKINNNLTLITTKKVYKNILALSPKFIVKLIGIANAFCCIGDGRGPIVFSQIPCAVNVFKFS